MNARRKLKEKSQRTSFAAKEIFQQLHNWHALRMRMNGTVGDFKSEFGQQQRRDDEASFQTFVVQQRKAQCGQKGSGPKLLVLAAQGKSYKLFR